MKVCLYARVSSAGQAEKDLSIPAQLKALRKYAADKNMQIVNEYVDEAQTGTNADRPQFQKMMAAAKSKQKPFDAILVWKFNRAFRSVEDAALYEGMLNRKGIALISITEPVSSDAAGNFQRHVLHAVNQFFSEQLSQDIRRGLAQAASEGSWCRPVPAGYKITKVDVNGKVRNRLELDPERAPLIREIFEMALGGVGANNISNSLNQRGIRTASGSPWARQRILSILKNEHYTGVMVFGKTRKIKGKAIKNDESQVIQIYNSHPALVTKEEFERVGKLIQSRNRQHAHPRTISSNYLLSGLLRCGCGSAMSGHAFSNNRYPKYVCGAKKRFGNTVCTAANLDREPLETAVLDKLTDYILAEDNIREIVRLSNESIIEQKSNDMSQSLEAELKKARQKLERYLDAIADGEDIPELKSRIRETRQRIAELEKQLYQLVGETADRPEPLHEADVMRQVYQLQHVLADAEPEARKSMLRSFIKSITVKLPTVTIEYTLPMAGKSGIDMTCIDKDIDVA